MENKLLLSAVSIFIGNNNPHEGRQVLYFVNLGQYDKTMIKYARIWNDTLIINLINYNGSIGEEIK